MNSQTISLSRFPRRVSSLANPWKVIKNLRGRYLCSISEKPHVFVLGAPRSGTTLMFSILASHPSMAYIDCETFFFVPRDIFNLSSYKRLADNSNISLKEIGDHVKSSEDVVRLYDSIAADVMTAGGGSRFLEKTPFHILYIDFLIKHFPNAKFVNMVRDGRDCYRSNKRLADYYHKPLENFSVVWRDSIRARQAVGNHPQVMDVKYEDLTTFPERIVRELMTFLGEDFFPYQIDPTHHSRPKIFENDKGHERLRQPIKPTSIGKWREKLTIDEIDYFQKLAGKELLAMGYEFAI